MSDSVLERNNALLTALAERWILIDDKSIVIDISTEMAQFLDDTCETVMRKLNTKDTSGEYYEVIMSAIQEKRDLSYFSFNNSMKPEKNSVSFVHDGNTYFIIRLLCQNTNVEDSITNTILNNAPISIIITDLNGYITYVNPFLCETTGYTEQELLGQRPSILRSPFTSDSLYKEMWNTILKGAPWSGVIQNKRKNGDFYWDNTMIVPIKGKDNLVSQFIAIKEDITIQKNLDDKLNEKSRLESVGRLASSVVHDFNNILTIINGFAEIGLLEMQNPQELQKDLSEIIQTAQKAASLTHQLLLFSRHQEISPAVIDFAQFSHNINDFLTRLIPEDIQFRINIQNTLLPIFADQGQCEQILVNLVVNAIDAIHSKSELSKIETISITVSNCSISSERSIHTTIPEGEYLEIEVHDTGSGIEDTVIKRIFEPFFTTKDSGKGTGLGLSTIYGIIQQNNAYIDVTSEIGVGTSFIIHWPLCDDAELIQEELKESSYVYGNNETILIVEDDLRLLKILSGELSSLNYKFLIVQNGIDALETIKMHKEEIHLLFTDLVMPFMSGHVLFKEIKEIAPEMKILFTSGYLPESLPLSFSDIIKDYKLLQKPYSMLELSVAIHEALHNKKGLSQKR